MQKTIIQFDRAFIKGKTEKTPEGFLICDAVIARPGVYDHIVNGKIHKRYMPPEIVLDNESIKTLKLKPVVDGHPYTEPGQKITPKNSSALKVGSVGESVRIDGFDVMAKFVVTDLSAIEKIESGDKRALSAGYETIVDFKPGVTPDGQKYDSIQLYRNYNHLSLEKTGRVGGALIALDSGEKIDFIEQQNIIKNEVKKMDLILKTISLDSVNYQVEPGVPEKIEGMKNEIKEKRIQLDSVNAERDTLKSDNQVLKAEIEKLKSMQLDESEIDKRANEKAELLAVATVQLDGVDLKGKSNQEIKSEICKKAYPEIALDGKSEDYINATYDRAIEKLQASDSADKSVKSGSSIRTVPKKPETQLDAVDSAKQAYIDRLQNNSKREVK